MSKRLFAVDEWKIIEKKLHPDDMRLSESVMSIGNGYMGMRGNFEEKYSGDTHSGIYIGGVWFPDKTRVGWWKNGYPEYFGKVINSADFIGIGLEVDGHEINLAVDQVIDFQRELDMKNAVLYRSFTVNTPSGRIAVRTERFLSIKQLEICAIRYMVCSLDNDASIKLIPFINGDVYNEDSNYKEKFWEETAREAIPFEASLTMKTKENDFGTPRFTSCTSMKITTKGTIQTCNEVSKENYVSSVIVMNAKKGEFVGIDKFIALTNTRNVPETELCIKSKTLVSAAASEGYDILKNEHSIEWNNRWEKADVEIKGDAEAQQGIRFNIFQLFSTYYGDDCRLNFGPKGFTGEKYGGATYWDTEAYVFPMYLSIASEEVARNLLIYRHNQLNEAIENARKIGLDGALYPMVTFTGVECHNEWEITFEEIHRNGAIAFAIFQYVSYTGDKSYLDNYGINVLVQISRFWASRVHYSGRNKMYMIHGVTGPNEYENNVNNNWYTNRMAAWCLEYTLECIEYLQESGKSQKIKDLSFSDKEYQKWTDIINNMYYPYDDSRDIFVQHDTFLDKDLKSVDEIPEGQRPINQNWSWDKILRSCYIKQADVLQGLYFLGHLYDKEVKRKNFLFYEPMTVHESSLSPCVHAILAAELGIEEKAVEMYKRTARLDLDNYNNDTADGLHITSMSGSWLAIVQGFAGMRTAQGKLTFNPFLPEGWDCYSFKVNYRGRRLKISVSKDISKIELELGEPLEITLFGKERLLDGVIEEKNRKVTMKGISFNSYNAFIFDLDGVVVDTAKYHYLAWKRLAAEYGYDFSTADNERFKGINRMACMNIMSELIGKEFTKEESIELANKKNNWYMEYVSQMPKDEVLPGFIDFIEQIRSKGGKTALASASKNAAIVLDRLEIRDCFDVIVDGNQIERSKPDPQVFLLAAQRLGASVSECIVFEDAQSGIDAANAAGMCSIGICTPENPLAGAKIMKKGFAGMKLDKLLHELA